jgi:hypothetical protein
MVHLEQKQDQIHTKDYKTRFGAYFTNIETHRKPRALHFSTLFMTRRLVIVLTIVFLRFSNVLQSLVAVHCSLLMLAWLIEVKPYDRVYKNYLEISNEFLITILGYFGFLFTDYVGNPATRYIFGFVYIGILAWGLLVNVLVLGYDAITDAFLKRSYYKREILSAINSLKSSFKPSNKPLVIKVEVTPQSAEKSIFQRVMEGEKLPPIVRTPEESEEYDEEEDEYGEESKAEEEIKTQAAQKNTQVPLNWRSWVHTNLEEDFEHFKSEKPKQSKGSRVAITKEDDLAYIRRKIDAIEANVNRISENFNPEFLPTFGHVRRDSIQTIYNEPEPP